MVLWLLHKTHGSQGGSLSTFPWIIYSAITIDWDASTIWIDLNWNSKQLFSALLEHPVMPRHIQLLYPLQHAFRPCLWETWDRDEWCDGSSGHFQKVQRLSRVANFINQTWSHCNSTLTFKKDQDTSTFLHPKKCKANFIKLFRSYSCCQRYIIRTNASYIR